MPHQCTGCGHVFPDGSKEMLSGCPDCGGNKFQFQPAGRGDAGPEAGGGEATGGTAPADAPADSGSAEPPEPPEPPGPSGVAGTVAGATERVRDLVSSDDTEWPAVGRQNARGGAAARSANEDTAQASARSGFADPDELPDHEPADGPAGPAPPAGPDASDPAGPGGGDPTSGGAGVDPGGAPFTGTGDREDDDADRPDLDELRAELNDQFESIKIVERGQYELNLMELYDREEYIISLMEDGRYAIEVPETWRGD